MVGREKHLYSIYLKMQRKQAHLSDIVDVYGVRVIVDDVEQDADYRAANPTVRLGNYSQISDKVPRVSETQIAVDHAGRGNEMDYQVALKTQELKIDLEAILFGTNQARNAGAAGTACRARPHRREARPGAGLRRPNRHAQSRPLRRAMRRRR